MAQSRGLCPLPAWGQQLRARCRRPLSPEAAGVSVPASSSVSVCPCLVQGCPALDSGPPSAQLFIDAGAGHGRDTGRTWGGHRGTHGEVTERTRGAQRSRAGHREDPVGSSDNRLSSGRTTDGAPRCDRQEQQDRFCASLTVGTSASWPPSPPPSPPQGPAGCAGARSPCLGLSPCVRGSRCVCPPTSLLRVAPSSSLGATASGQASVFVLSPSRRPRG